MRILVTGGAGFIGSALIRFLLNVTSHIVINVDKLTYASNFQSLQSILQNKNYCFEQVDICSTTEIQRIFAKYQPNLVMHLAAETHVDRSIKNAGDFIQTNIVGTYIMLENALQYWQSLSSSEKTKFRFHHISTDEVYGDLDSPDHYFTENTPYAPSSPYSASKASSDHLVRAWYRTYKLPIVITNCSNNYGPYQYPEKLIPFMIYRALLGESLPVYGNGLQIRDWLFVDDHVRALYEVVLRGKIGETYNIGGANEKTNIEVIQTLCHLMDELLPIKPKNIQQFSDLITYVQDRPGHDKRYAIDATKIKQELDWAPIETFESGIKRTLQWYLHHQTWLFDMINQNNRMHQPVETA